MLRKYSFTCSSLLKIQGERCNRFKVGNIFEGEVKSCLSLASLDIDI